MYVSKPLLMLAVLHFLGITDIKTLAKASPLIRSVIVIFSPATAPVV